jgi:hypothetical protein
MPEGPLSFVPPSREIRKSGHVVGLTDRVYGVEGDQVTFGEVLVRGDLSGDLEYNEHRLRVIRIDAIVGLLVDGKGARGPVWKGVMCEVLN